MKFTVGGEPLEITRDDVVRAMRGASIEPIRKHVVDIDGEVFPPKQVFAAVTKRERQSFTTMEAQRVLTRLGFECRRAERLGDGAAVWAADGLEQTAAASTGRRLDAVEAAIGTMQAAISGLQARVTEFERVR